MSRSLFISRARFAVNEVFRNVFAFYPVFPSFVELVDWFNVITGAAIVGCLCAIVYFGIDLLQATGQWTDLLSLIPIDWVHLLSQVGEAFNLMART
jgi:hypothetical protein